MKRRHGKTRKSQGGTARSPFVIYAVPSFLIYTSRRPCNSCLTRTRETDFRSAFLLDSEPLKAYEQSYYY